MHNPTGSQMAKILRLYANLPNPANLMNPLHSQNVLLHCHAINVTLTSDACCSVKHDCSQSCSHSRSRSRHCHDDVCHSQHSSCPCHDDYVGQPDFPIYACKPSMYCHPDSLYTWQTLCLPKNPTDFLNKLPVSHPHGYSDSFVPSGDADHFAILMDMVNMKILSLQLMLLQLIPMMMTMIMIVTCTLVRNLPKLTTLSTSATI